MVQFNNDNKCNKYEKCAGANHISCEQAFLALMQKEDVSLIQLLLVTIIPVIVVLCTSQIQLGT